MPGHACTAGSHGEHAGVRGVRQGAAPRGAAGSARCHPRSACSLQLGRLPFPRPRHPVQLWVRSTRRCFVGVERRPRQSAALADQSSRCCHSAPLRLGHSPSGAMSPRAQQTVGAAHLPAAPRGRPRRPLSSALRRAPGSWQDLVTACATTELVRSVTDSFTRAGGWAGPGELALRERAPGWAVARNTQRVSRDSFSRRSPLRAVGGQPRRLPAQPLAGVCFSCSCGLHGAPCGMHGAATQPRRVLEEVLAWNLPEPGREKGLGGCLPDGLRVGSMAWAGPAWGSPQERPGDAARAPCAPAWNVTPHPPPCSGP